MPRPQERRMRGTERVHQEFPLRFDLLLIVTRMGRDYRPGPRERIKQVARKGSANPPPDIDQTFLPGRHQGSIFDLVETCGCATNACKQISTPIPSIPNRQCHLQQIVKVIELC